MDHMKIYEAVRAVPDTAKREIKGGRLVGRTDINPVWRIKALTEQFGPCGIGWKYTIDKCWVEPSPTKEIAAFVVISLYIKVNDVWSEPIPGTGGSMYVINEKSGLYTNDECYKMALTDAISVSCKSLGVGADVYWEKDVSKYTGAENRTDSAPSPQPQPPTSPPPTHNSNGTTAPPPPGGDVISEAQAKRMFAISKGNAELCKSVLQSFGYENSREVRKADYENICKDIEVAVAEDLPF